MCAGILVREGKLVGREHFLLDCSPEEDEAEILKAFIEQFYAEAAFVPKSIFLPWKWENRMLESWLSELRGSRVRMHVPKRGTKKQLVDMVMENARTVLQVVRSRAERQEADINERCGSWRKCWSWMACLSASRLMTSRTLKVVRRSGFYGCYVERKIGWG